MGEQDSKPKKADPIWRRPFQIGRHRLKNRLVALPIYTGYAHTDGRVSSLMIDHYQRLAEAGAAMVVVGNAAVSADGVVTNHNLRVDRDEFVPGLSTLAAAIKGQGALACLQLNHGGRFAKTDQPLLPSPIDGSNLNFNIASLKDFMNFFPLEQRFGLTRYFLNQAGKWRRAMSAADIGHIIVAFGKAASRARQAGFDMIELHGANGYLLCQFLSAFTNRIDSTSHETFYDRAAIPIAVIREVKQELPEEFPVGFRLMTREWVPEGIDLPEAVTLAGLLQREGIAYLSASVGSYNSIFTEDARQKMARPAYLQADMQRLTEAVDVPTIISGRIAGPAVAAKIIQEGAADLIGLGRPLRTDIKWIQKAIDQKSRIKTCINCNWCLKRVVMDQGFACALWPKRLKARIELEHQLLTRNYKGLWVIADADDIELFRNALGQMLPDHKKAAAFMPTILFLTGDSENNLSAEIRESFAEWCKGLLASSGFSDAVLTIRVGDAAKGIEKEVHSETTRGNHGVVIFGRNRYQPWRDRLLHQESGKMMALLGTHRRYDHVLVPVDLSDVTRLVLLLLHRSLLNKVGINVEFVHVLRGSAAQAERRWLEIERIVGLDDALKLKFLTSQGNVVDTLLGEVTAGRYGTVVMGKRGLSGMKRWMLGSVSQGVLNGLRDQSLILID